MEPLPKGANFVRAKTLWEIGLHLAGNPATPYGGNRDMIITIDSGSGATLRPWLRPAIGSPILAEPIAKGDGVDLAFVNLRRCSRKPIVGSVCSARRFPCASSRSIPAGTASCS